MAVEAILEALKPLQRAVEETEAPEDLARLLVALRDAQAALRAVTDACEGRLVKALAPERHLSVPGLGEVEVLWGTERRKWDSEGLFSTVLRVVADPEGTGELLDGAELLAAVSEGLRRVLPLTGSLSWRVDGLRSLGIEPDRWCERGPTSARVRIDRRS